MSKAIISLVMDMPNSCDVCEFVKESRACDGDLFCNNPLSQQYGHIVTDYIICRADGCPLRELPQKQTVHCTDTAHHRFAKDGWNHCIDTILKEGAE